MFFVSVADKGLSVVVSGLESTVASGCVSVDSKGGYGRVFRAFLQVLILNSLRRKPQVEETSPSASSAVRKRLFVPERTGALFTQSRSQNSRGDGNRKKRQPFGSAQGKQTVALQEIPHPYLVRILTNRLRAVKRFLRQGVRNRSGRRERSFQRQARQIQELVEAVGNGFAVGASAVVVEEDDGGIFYTLVGGGNPIPRAAAGGGEAKAGAKVLFVWQFVEGFEVQRLKTVDLPALGPPARTAGLFELEPGSPDGGFVLVQLEESFGKKLAQLFLDGVGLRMQEAADVGIVGGLQLISGRARTESCDGSAHTRDDDQERGGEDEWAEDEEKKFVHALMILHRLAAASTLGSDRNLRNPSVRPGTWSTRNL